MALLGQEVVVISTQQILACYVVLLPHENRVYILNTIPAYYLELVNGPGGCGGSTQQILACYVVLLPHENRVDILNTIPAYYLELVKSSILIISE